MKNLFFSLIQHTPLFRYHQLYFVNFKYHSQQTTSPNTSFIEHSLRYYLYHRLSFQIMNNIQKMLDLSSPAEDGHAIYVTIETHDHQSYHSINVERLALHIDCTRSSYNDVMSHLPFNGGIRQQPNLWFCCHCDYTNNCALSERCVGCEHTICSECRKQSS